MNHKENLPAQKLVVNPGYVCISKKPALLYAVVGSAVVVTIYDGKRKIGGMSHFVSSESSGKTATTPYCAYPSITSLISEMKKDTDDYSMFEASIYGGADNSEKPGYIKDQGRNNIEAANKILSEAAIDIVGCETGGKNGRKVIFNTRTGEVIVARVSKIREKDWYPPLLGSN